VLNRVIELVMRLEVLRKTTTNFSQDGECPGQYSNQGFSNNRQKH